MKPKIFVTRKLPQAALDKVASYFEMEINPDDRVLTKAEIIKGLKGKDALLCLLTDTIDAEVMDSCPQLRVISNYAVGFNNINVPEATKRQIPVCNTPDVLTETTADMAWALLMSVARRIVEGDKFTRAGKFNGWGPMMLLGGDIYGKTLGLIGCGRIGAATARRALGFSMKVIYYDIARNAEIEKSVNAKFVDMDTVLKESDFVSLHVPLNDKTKHLIGEKQLRMMKKTAYLINTARGPVIDEKALVKILSEKVIAGAGLDVYEEEPKLAAGLADLENVVIPPHIASATIDTRTNMGLIAANNAISIFEGTKPYSCANPEVLGLKKVSGA